MNLTAPMIRTFRARDARSALTAVKAAFGSDAVIIETKQVSGGLFGRPQIEVTAASSTDGRGSTKATTGRAAESNPGANAAASSTLESDIAALRRVMDDVRLSLKRGRGTGSDPQRDRADDDHDLTLDARRVLRHLVDRGMNDLEARALLDDALATGAERSSEIFAAVIAEIAKRLIASPSPWSADARRTIALVGPTGVGKTTAIAKIAARALLETRFKIGLITVDTYRVGASDQLARYGKIMGVPTYVARDREALASAVERTRDADLVLIDTAGRSDAESLAAQMDLVRSAPNVQLHLVMSVATGARELGAVARRYKSLGAERLIFTKLDEADGPAGALSATALLGRPVSCICDGQRVPEDIHEVTQGTLIERLLAPPAAFAPPRRSTPLSSGKEQLRGSGR